MTEHTSAAVLPFTRGGGALVHSASPNALRRAVLSAQLAPGLTVEQACHLNVNDLPDELVPRMETMIQHWRMLRAAGLDTDGASGHEPAALLLIDERQFVRHFPALAAAVKPMKDGGGVIPYTAGLPRKLAAL